MSGIVRSRSHFEDCRGPVLYAAVARPPHASCAPRGADERAARAVDGVRDVVRIPTGIAVIADSTWAALRGRDASARSGTTQQRAPDSTPRRCGRRSPTLWTAVAA